MPQGNVIRKMFILFLCHRCKPVHVSYQFYKQPLHKSAGRDHGSDVFWEDVNVVLLGTLEKGGLAEYLQGPHFQVDVHDRDRKIENKKLKPSLFGENPEDEMINNVSLVAGRTSSLNPKLRSKLRRAVFHTITYQLKYSASLQTLKTKIKSKIIAQLPSTLE